jgi:hypothetical protein
VFPVQGVFVRKKPRPRVKDKDNPERLIYFRAPGRVVGTAIAKAMAGQIQRTSGKRNKTFHENIFFGRLEVFNGGASGFCSVSFPN